MMVPPLNDSMSTGIAGLRQLIPEQIQHLGWNLRKAKQWHHKVPVRNHDIIHWFVERIFEISSAAFWSSPSCCFAKRRNRVIGSFSKGLLYIRRPLVAIGKNEGLGTSALKFPAGPATGLIGAPGQVPPWLGLGEDCEVRKLHDNHFNIDTNSCLLGEHLGVLDPPTICNEFIWLSVLNFHSIK